MAEAGSAAGSEAHGAALELAKELIARKSITPEDGGCQELLAKRGLVADRVSWVAGAPPHDGPFEAQVRIRYRGEDVAAVIAPTSTGFDVAFRSPQRAVAPGQSCVVVRGDEVLGGGRIVSATGGPR